MAVADWKDFGEAPDLHEAGHKGAISHRARKHGDAVQAAAGWDHAGR